MGGAGMLHLRELRVLRCVVCLERQRGCGKIGLSLRPLFPPLDATCPARLMGAAIVASLVVLLVVLEFVSHYLRLRQ